MDGVATGTKAWRAKNKAAVKGEMAQSRIPPEDTPFEAEGVVAGAVVSYCVQDQSNDFAKDIFKICPPTTAFINIRAKEILDACFRLCAKGVQIDLLSVADEMRQARCLCTVPELAEIATYGWNTRAGTTLAAQKIVERNRKDQAKRQLASAMAQLATDAPPDTAITLVNEALAVLGGIDPHKPKHVLDLVPLTAERFLPYPPNFEWLLQYSLLLNELGLLIGPPGAGKSFIALYFACHLAAGRAVLDVWEPGQGPITSLIVSAEDSEAVLWRRFYHVMAQMHLTAEERQQVATRVFPVAVAGDVAFFHRDQKTDAPAHLRALIQKTGAKLVLLDNAARFYGGDENSNGDVQLFCGELEGIMKEMSCNIILLHHTNKSSGDTLNDEKILSDALKQGALRGASAFAGAARWMMNLAPIGSDLAEKLFGEDAPPGTYVAARVSKKNTGAPEPRHYFKRGEHGLLCTVEAARQGKEGTIEADARALADEVRRREAAGEAPLSESTGGRDALGCGTGKGKKIAEKAIQLGLLEAVDRGKGKGKILKYRDSQEGQYFGMFNYE